MVSRPVLASTSTSAGHGYIPCRDRYGKLLQYRDDVNDCRRREVRPRDVFHQPFMLMSSSSIYARQPLMTSVRLAAGCWLPYLQRYRKNRSPAGRNFGWHDVRNFFRAVIVINESTVSFSRSAISSWAIFARRFPYNALPPQSRRRWNRSYPDVYQHVTQREWLRHTDDRVITAESPWGWYLPITSPTTRADFYRLCSSHCLVRSWRKVRDGYRLQAISDIWQRTANNDRHP